MNRTAFAARHFLPLMAAVLILTLSACESEDTEATPGADVSPIYTAAAQTITAQQATQVPLLLPVIPAPATPAAPGTVPAVAVPVTGGGAGHTTAPGTCQNAAFVSDVTVPDGTIMAPGQTFVKTWAVTNTGTCAWTAGDKLVLVDGAPMGGSDVPLAGSVAPGQTADLSVSLSAPVAPGNYTGTWRLKDAAGNYFGDVVTVVITVSGPADP